MKKIIYYVASSLDGYIAGPGDDISKFSMEGSGVEKYLADLQLFKTVIMGRRTYEFGYKYGMKPGDPAYPHMEHFIFSDSLVLEHSAPNVHVRERNIDLIKDIKEHSETDVYICGGGIFASWLLESGLIDEVWIKLNPIILGGGTPLFSGSVKPQSLNLISSEAYENGLFINKYGFK